MKVYNLTGQPHFFRGKVLPPNGGFLDIPMDFIPDRDLALEKAGVLAFGALPATFVAKQRAVSLTPAPVKTEAKLPVVDSAAAADDTKFTEAKGELKAEKLEKKESKKS